MAAVALAPAPGDEGEGETGSRTTSSICCWRRGAAEWKGEEEEEEDCGAQSEEVGVDAGGSDADADRASDVMERVASLGDSDRERDSPADDNDKRINHFL